MKVFAIRDEEDNTNKDLAYLIYYEFSKKFYIELPENADEWETPLLLSSFVKRGKKTINSYWSKIWVQQRIVPIDRQNLGLILKENNLTEYDEYNLLMLSKGRCAQDSYYLVPIDKNIIETKFYSRLDKRISDAIPLSDYHLLLFLRNGKVIMTDIKAIKNNDRVFNKVLSNKDIFNKVKVAEGGYGVCWGDNIFIQDEELYFAGFETPLTIDDFMNFVKHNIINTIEAAELLDCSRQNINDLVKRGKLNPIKTDQKNYYFLKSEILERHWK